MANPRSLRHLPVILSLSFVIIVIVGVGANIPTLLNLAVNQVLSSSLDESYRAEFQGVSVESLQGFDADSIVVHARTETEPVQQLRISEIRVRVDLLAILRGTGIASLQRLDVAEVAVLVRQGTLDSLFDGGSSRGKSPGETDTDADRVAAVERRISDALTAIPAGIGGPITVSLYEEIPGDHGTDALSTSDAPFSVPSSLIATAALSVYPGGIETTVSHAAYSVSLGVHAEEAATLSAEMRGSGPGVAVSARVDQRGVTFSTDLSPSDFRFSPSFPLPEMSQAFDTASVSLRLDRSGEASPSPQESAPRGVQVAGASSSLLALQDALRTVQALFDGTEATQTDTATAPLPAMRATFAIRNVSLAGIVPALDGFDGLPPIPAISATIHTNEDSVGGTGEVDGGTLGTVTVRDVVIPVSQPRAISVANLEVDIPPGMPVALEALPPELLPPLRTLGIVDTEGDVTLPSVSIGASAKDGLVDVAAHMEHAPEHSGGFAISAEGRADLVDEIIALSSVQSRWNDGTRLVEADGSLRATSDELRALSAFSPIPAGIVAAAAMRFESDDTTVSLDANVKDGRLYIETLEARHQGSSYALIDPTGDRTATVARIEAQPGAYHLTRSEIRLDPGTVTLAGIRITPGNISGEIEYRDVPVTRILDFLAAADQAAGTPASPAASSVSGATSSNPTPAITGGRLSGEVRFNTEHVRPRFAATVRGEALTVFGESGSITVEIEQDATGLRVERGAVDLGNLLTGTFSGRLPIAVTRSGVSLLNLTDSSLNASLRSARFDTFFPYNDDQLRPEGALTVEMELLEQTGDLHAEANFLVRPERNDAGAPDFSGFGYERLRGTIRATEDRSDGLTISVRLTADGTEILDATVEARIPGLSQAAPTLIPQEITWQLDASSELPLEYIAPFFPGLVALTGRVSSGITGSGTLATPTLSGILSVADGELRTAGPIPAISAINGTIWFQDTRFFTEQFSAESGLSPFTVSVDGTLPSVDEPGTLTASLQGTNLLITTSPLLRVRADIDLSLAGSLSERLALTGLITVRDGLYSQDIPLIAFDAVPSIDPDKLQLFSVQSAFASRTDLDLRILADETFRVENNLYQGAFSTDLTLLGTLEVPRPQGRVFADSGRLILPLTSLQMGQAVLRFRRDRPFTPDVQASGTTRIRRYQLSVTVSGTLPGVEVSVTTAPPLPQSDALVLLSTGFTPQELSSSGNRAGLVIGSRLGTQFVQSLVGSDDGGAGEGLADRVSVLLGEEVSESGAGTIEIEFRLTDEASWFLVFRRDQYERYNMDLAWRFWVH